MRRLQARWYRFLAWFTRPWCRHGDYSWTGDRKGNMRCDVCGGRTGETWLEEHLP